MNTNPEKRLKKFQKEMSLFINHPNYNDVKELYVNNVIKSIVSAEKALNKIKITKKGNIYKSSMKAQEKVIQQVDVLKTKQEEQKLEKNFVKQRIIKLDDEKINNLGYGFLTNKIEFQKIRKEAPNCYYVQDVKFYNNKGQLINDGIFTNLVFDYIHKNTKQFKTFIKKVDFNMSIDGSDGRYKPTVLINENDKNFVKQYKNGKLSYTIITTTAYKLETKDLKVDLKQIYKEADSGHCVYDAFLNYFESRKEVNKNAKAIYNKLVNNDELKKSYTDDNINEIASFCNSTLKIRDLVNGVDKDFKNDYSRFHVELLNTKYNHLDLLYNTYNNIEEVESEKYLELKKNLSFYIEKNGLLITCDKTYKIKPSKFNEIYNEWKDKVNYNSLYIDENSKLFQFISNYDYSLHTFFNNFEVNNDLYNELDLVKAYYNYSNKNINNFYNGVPSGSFVDANCDENFNIDTFNKLSSNKLLGYFEVKILKINDKFEHFKKLGLTLGTKHILTTCQINLLKDYIDFKFLNCCYSPSVDIPFNSKFLEKDKEGIKHYCRAFGLMLSSSNEIDITIKPLDNDVNYYNTIYNDNYDIYKVDGLVKISLKDKLNKSFIHIAYYIHSYIRTLIINQLLNMNIDDIFGVKLDSIVVKKSSKFDYNKSLFGEEFKKCNIEEMLKVRNYSALDYGLNIESSNNYSSSYYRPYFESTNDNIQFDKPFLYTGEYITNRVVFIGGSGGSGKTSSILRSLDNKNICYSTSCWNLIQGQKDKNPDIMGFSLPNLTGFCSGYKTEKIKSNKIKYLVIDELTLIDQKTINRIINDPLYKHCFIFLLGDVEYDGFYYQCSLPNISISNPSKLNCQYVKYTKSYRFDENLLAKLNDLRFLMKNNSSIDDLNLYIQNNFNFYNKEDIIFNDSDVGISAINDFENNNNELTNYFLSKGTKPQYFIKNTNRKTGQLKGQQLDDKPSHNNYECKLFKTIHSYQGLELDNDNKIIISITKNFDYNLFYTALSRAHRIDQIILLNN